jgi:hypothetical protein
VRDCTCVGVCRGADGLGAGWRCAMSPSAPGARTPEPDKDDAAFAAYRADPSLKTGNALLRAVRERLEMPMDNDAMRFSYSTNEEVADALEGSKNFTPAACHWALDVAASRLRAVSPVAGAGEPGRHRIQSAGVAAGLAELRPVAGAAGGPSEEAYHAALNVMWPEPKEIGDTVHGCRPVALKAALEAAYAVDRAAIPRASP